MSLCLRWFCLVVLALSALSSGWARDLPSEPRQRAVLIGVAQHDQPRLNLQFSVRDVQALREVLAGRAGIPEDQILELSDRTAGQLPTLARIREEVPRFLKRARSQDRVVVFFSGHGEVCGGKLYLVPRDVRRDQIDKTGWPAGELYQALKACPARTKLLILDCCHAGTTRSADAPPSLPVSQWVKSLEEENVPGDLVVLASCRDREHSREWPERRQGVFTYWLCRALEGGATDRNGRVTAAEVNRYLSERVPQTTRELYHDAQTPLMYGVIEGAPEVLVLKPEKPESLCRRLAQHLHLEMERRKIQRVALLDFSLLVMGTRDRLMPDLVPAFCTEQLRRELRQLAKDRYQLVESDRVREAARGVTVERVGPVPQVRPLGQVGGLQAVVLGHLMLRGPVVQVESVLLDTDSGERLLTTFGLLTLDHWPNLQRQIGQREQTLQARAILQAHCYRCHHGRAPQEGGFDVLETANLLAPRPGGAIVVPGDLERSPLWRRLGREQSMPPQEISRRPSPAEMKTIQRWLEAGSLSWSQETAGRQPIPLQKVLRAIRAHLVQANRTDQPYLRYFTLAHLYNNPRLPETDLNVQRAALAKTINSLSWKPRLVLPTQVDVDGTVYAIDLRDLGWEPQRHWQALMGAYPYGLALDRHVDGEVQQLYQEIVAQSSCRLAFVRADWFVARASQPPLYYTLLGLPAASTKLDERLGIDLPGAFQQGRLVRSGFMQSRLSGQNRLVERCDTPHGALWRSYDFRKDGEKNNLARFPLGPVFPRHPHPALAFVHDVSAVLFHLPNGLMAYLLADGQGRRLDEAPVEVFHDALRTSGQVKVTAGLSCIACHSSGIKLLPGDALREGAAIFGRARDKLQRLHPDKAQVDELLQQDEVHFMRAAEKVAGPYLWTLAGPDTPFRNLPEPVGECSRLYNLDGLDLNMTAWELGLADPGPLRARIQSDPALKALGLGILLLEGGRIPRSDWEKEAFSLMQRVARSLKLGLPLREANPIP